MPLVPHIQPLLGELARYKNNQEQSFIGASYDSLGDVPYMSFHEPNIAAEIEVTDDDIIVRYDEREKIIGFTILNASKRL
jgi:uncharacterized protein YuzE